LERSRVSYCMSPGLTALCRLAQEDLPAHLISSLQLANIKGRIAATQGFNCILHYLHKFHNTIVSLGGFDCPLFFFFCLYFLILV